MRDARLDPDDADEQQGALEGTGWDEAVEIVGEISPFALSYDESTGVARAVLPPVVDVSHGAAVEVLSGAEVREEDFLVDVSGFHVCRRLELGDPDASMQDC